MDKSIRELTLNLPLPLVWYRYDWVVIMPEAAYLIAVSSLWISSCCCVRIDSLYAMAFWILLSAEIE
ncbi:hypothetical protein D3C74_309640 [compost metagenome]